MSRQSTTADYFDPWRLPLRMMVLLLYLVLFTHQAVAWAQIAIAPAEIKTPVIERAGWSFDRSEIGWPPWSDPEKRRSEGRLYDAAGWVEYDFTIERAGWYSLWQKGVPLHWTRDVMVDGKIVRRLHTTTEQDLDPKDRSWSKECNLPLTAGQHTLRFRRMEFPGVLPSAWRLIYSDESPEGCMTTAPLRTLVVQTGQPVPLKVTSGTSTPLVYTLMLRPEPSGELQEGPTLTFPATTEPTVQTTTVIPKRQGVYQLLARTGEKTLKPADVGLARIIAIDAALPASSNIEQTCTEEVVVDIDCAAAPSDNYFENGTPAVVIDKPWGKYRQTTGPELNHIWAMQAFSYRFDLPDHQGLYKLVVDYPDDDRRTMGFWLNDGANISGTIGVTLTGGVETGDRYTVTNQMQKHEAIFYPRNHQGVVVAVVNLTPGCTAAASRIRIYKLNGNPPSASIPNSRGRVLGYGFEEPGRWLRHFGGESDSLDQQILTMERWAERNAMMGANLMMPTINVYQANQYNSDVLIGYFNTPDDQVRMAALVARKHGNKFVPEFHLSGQGGFDRLVMGVWTEKDAAGKPQVRFADDAARELIHVDSQGSDNLGWSGFLYNALHPRVQEKYIEILGELADRLGDCESFAGISSRLMLSWQWQGWNALPGLKIGYSDWTIAQFQKETGVVVPGAADQPDRFRERYLYLTGPGRAQWVRWRCDKIFAFHKALRDRIRKARPDAQLFFTYFGDAGGGCLSGDPIEQLREIGIDPKLYENKLGIVLIPHAGFGRRMSTPLSDSCRWDEVTDVLKTTLGRLGGRGFGLASTYFEPNNDFDWTKLGGKPYAAFDTSTPAHIHERELYALALADNDSSLFVTGGNGNIFGTRSVLTPFLREFRSLPNVPFDPLPDERGGRDPVAVWQKVHDGKRFFYAVNRLPVPVDVRLQVSAPAKVQHAVDDANVPVDRHGWMSFKLEPFMIQAFISPSTHAQVIQCQAVTDPEFRQKVEQVLKHIRPLRDQVKARQVAVELSQEQADEVLRLMDEAIDGAKSGRYFRAWGNLFRPAMVHLYDLTGSYPVGLFSRQAPRGLVGVDQRPKIKLSKIIGDVRGHLAQVSALTYDAQGNLYAASDGNIMCFDHAGRYIKSLTLVGPHIIPTAELNGGTWLSPPDYWSGITMLATTPRGELGAAKGWGLPSVFDTQNGRLLRSLPQRQGSVFYHVAFGASGNAYISVSEPANLAGLYRVPDGWAGLKQSLRKPVMGIRGLAVGPNERTFVSTKDSIQGIDGNGATVFTANVNLHEGPARLAVSHDKSLLFASSWRGPTLVCFQIDPGSTDQPLRELWRKQLSAQSITDMAMKDSRTLTIGLGNPTGGKAIVQLQVGVDGCVETEFSLPTLEAVAPNYLRGPTQLKVHHGAIYFLSDNNLCRLDPEKNDAIEIVYRSGVSHTPIESFAFSPSGDLYLGSAIGLYNHAHRGTNVYVAARQGEGWGKPEMLNDNQPLVSDIYAGVSDMEFDDQGQLLMRHAFDVARTPKPGLSIGALTFEETRLVDAKPVVEFPPGHAWGVYGLYQTQERQLLVTSGATRSILCLNKDGSVRFQTKYAPHQGPEVLPLREPAGITQDQQRRIWVTDAAANQILCFDDSGRLLGRYGQFGNIDIRDAVAFSKPQGIAAIHHAGKQWLYVADINNQRLVKLEID